MKPWIAIKFKTDHYLPYVLLKKFFQLNYDTSYAT